MKICLYLTTIFFAVVVVVACSNEEDASTGAEEVADETEVDDTVNDEPIEVNGDEDVIDENKTQVATESEDIAVSSDDAEEDSSVEDLSTEVSASSLPETLELDETQYHENGTILTLESIHFNEEYITVNITVLNASGKDISITAAGRTGAELEDDTGETMYYYQPPKENESLDIPEGDRMTASLIFVGMLPEEATSLHLTLNSIFGGSSRITHNPMFEFEDISLGR
ncbi:hypothetical protein [Bacillus alkalicola]|uniref:DUF4352 domain-containing protein n=2 Tax=Bacillaceae TaxID=186817 RepID=A0ABS6JXQ2_9BACI|nr:hypothetical protein [Bacillus alkalicola]MBU9723368.1 hypothetical protein [Bacillus alkalicola]